MPGKRIPDLPAIAGASTANDDNLVIFDTDAGATKRILRSQLAAGLVGDLPYTPSGGISATTVPTAIAELDTEKVAFTRLDDSDGSSLVGYAPAGTGAVAATVQTKLREFVSVLDFGADPTGVSSSHTAITNALSSGAKRIYFPTGTYLLTTGLVLSGADVCLFGDGATSKITSTTLKNVLQLGDLSRAVFEGLAFETTVNNASENTYGVVWSENRALTDVTFSRCYFYAPNANTNGVKVINQDADISDQVRFIECWFEGIQRMGVEWQNHVDDGVYRYRGVVIDKCVFKDIGVGTGYGFAVSLSGLGENCIVSNNTFDNIKIGLELVGASDTTVAFNKFRSFGAGGRAFSFTGAASRTMYRNRVIGNTLEASSGSPLFYTQQDLVLHGNYWLLGSSVNFRDVVRARISDDQYDSSGASAISIEGVSTDNQFVNCRISNARSSSNQATFRTSGAGTTGTRLIGCRVIQGTGGVPNDAINSAQAAVLLLNTLGTSGSPTCDPFRIGNKTNLGVRRIAGAGVFTTALTIDFGTASSWEPAVVNVRIASNSGGGGSTGYTENLIFVRHLTGTVTVVNNQVVGTASNLTVTTSASGNVLTLTCTHATTAANTFIWDVSVSCLQNPVLG